MVRSRSILAAAPLVAVLLCLPSVARSGEHQHKVKSGETLSSIARAYYGAAWKSVYILARNQLDTAAVIKVGDSLLIPSSWLYVVRRGDTLAKLARKYLGEAERFSWLMKDNRLKSANVNAGVELLMPFHLFYTVREGDSLSAISRLFYRTNRRSGDLKSYNSITTIQPGDRLTVPIFDRATLDVKEKAKSLGRNSPTAGTLPAAGAEPTIDFTNRVTDALRGYRVGNFRTACSALEDLLAEDALPPESRLAVIRHLGYCAVAYNDVPAAQDYFGALLEIDPKAQLDPTTVSPKIIDVFDTVRKARKTQVLGQ